ncbi:MAG: RluA family pseudouridine synthase [Pseudomonadota bacterium]
MAVIRTKATCRLIDFLMDRGHTRTKIKQLLKHRAIVVNGEAVKNLDQMLLHGDTVEVRKEKNQPVAAPSMGIRVVHEDDAVIVIEKPAGLLTMASETEKIKTAYYQVNEFLKLRSRDTRERIFIVHRLDRDTSGLIVFAKNAAGKRAIQGSWKEAEKRYYAIVEGTPAKKEGEIRSSLSETKSLKVYSDRHSGEAKPALTKYRLLRQGRVYALLDILLETGRKNQIRVHLADLGHPVAGDKKYGAQTDPLRRLGLHAYLLSFNHPDTGQLLRFESSMPAKFDRLIREGSEG